MGGARQEERGSESDRAEKRTRIRSERKEAEKGRPGPQGVCRAWWRVAVVEPHGRRPGSDPVPADTGFEGHERKQKGNREQLREK